MPKSKRNKSPKSKPYIFMAFSICSRYCFPTQRENGKFFSKAWLACILFLILSFTQARQAFAENEIPQLSILKWQLIGLDNEFPSRNKKKLESLHKLLGERLVTAPSPTATWLESKGHTLPLNLKNSLKGATSGESKIALEAPAYVVPILCQIGKTIVVAVELVDLKQHRLMSSRQVFTAQEAWEQDSAPTIIDAEWAEALAKVKGIDEDTKAYKLGLTLRRGSNSSIEGSYQCLNMLLAHELQKSLNVPTPLDLLEGYRLRSLSANPGPVRSTRTLAVDWGDKAEGPNFKTQINISESVMGANMERELSVIFKWNTNEQKLDIPEDFLAMLLKKREELLSQDLPQVAKIYGAWAYLDRGRAWGLEMNDRLYFDDNGRKVKGHVVAFYTNKEKLNSPRGFPIQEGAILYIRKGQKAVKVGDTFQFDPTAYPTPWPPVPQPMPKANP